MSRTLAAGANIIVHQMVNSVDTPIYPITKFKNVYDSNGVNLEDILGAASYVPAIPQTTSSLTVLGVNSAGTAAEWHTIQSASTSQAGVVQLATTLSTSETEAATIAAVKTVSDALSTFTGTTAPDTYVALSQIGPSALAAATAKTTRLATLDVNGKVPSAQLPSYVDDVIEGTLVDDTTFTPAVATDEVGVAGKIYVDTTTGKTYRWSGTQYTVISETLATGTVAGTAYDGASGQDLADRLATLEAGILAPLVNSTAHNTINNGTITVTTGKTGALTTKVLTVYDDSALAEFKNKDALDVVTEGLNGTGISSDQSAAQKAAILNLIGKRDSTTGEFVLASSSVNGLMSSTHYSKVENGEQVIISNSTTAPTFATGSGIWLQIVADEE